MAFVRSLCCREFQLRALVNLTLTQMIKLAVSDKSRCVYKCSCERERMLFLSRTRKSLWNSLFDSMSEQRSRLADNASCDRRSAKDLVHIHAANFWIARTRTTPNGCNHRNCRGYNYYVLVVPRRKQFERIRGGKQKQRLEPRRCKK